LRIVLASMFRDSVHYFDDYFVRCMMLKEALRLCGHSLRYIWVEGDSTDHTWERLHEVVYGKGLDTTIIKVEHGKTWTRAYSPDISVRWEALSFVCNAALDKLKPEDDVLIWVESDLLWNPSVMLMLLEHLKTVPAVAPMIFAQNGVFYDVHGFRKDARRFDVVAPYHPALAPGGLGNGQLVRIDCAGSCLIMRGEVARAIRFGDGDVHTVGLGLSIYSHGYSLWLDPRLHITHP
jgi:hypothetical protein